MNWQVAVTICNSYRLQTTNGDNYPYILQWIINSLWHREITSVTNFFVHKVRNHNYGKSFEFQFYETQWTPGITNFEGNLQKVCYIRSSLKRELPVHRKTNVYRSYTIGWVADKDKSLFLLSEPSVNVQHFQVLTRFERNAEKLSKTELDRERFLNSSL